VINECTISIVKNVATITVILSSSLLVTIIEYSTKMVIIMAQKEYYNYQRAWKHGLIDINAGARDVFSNI